MSCRFLAPFSGEARFPRIGLPGLQLKEMTQSIVCLLSLACHLLEIANVIEDHLMPVPKLLLIECFIRRELASHLCDNLGQHFLLIVEHENDCRNFVLDIFHLDEKFRLVIDLEEFIEDVGFVGVFEGFLGDIEFL